MKVIIAGFSKTGTKTVSAALSELGYEVYDFVDHFWYHGKEWMKILQDNGTVDDFKRMYENVDAVCDVPAFAYWEEIHEAFPDAKIIFTTRDEDIWVDRIAHQFADADPLSFPLRDRLIAVLCPTVRRYVAFVKVYFWICYGMSYGSSWEGIKIGKLSLRKRYQQHNTYLLQKAPKDKLLILDLKEGWNPLCKFLGKDVPNKPFPWKNKNGSAIAEMIRNHPYAKQVEKECLVICGIFVAIVGILFYALFVYFF